MTGIGVITPIGIGKDEFWSSCLEGRTGIRPVTGMTTCGLRSHLAHQVVDPPYNHFISAGNMRRMDRISRMVTATARLAIQDAGLDLTAEDPERVGIMIGTGLASSRTVDLFFRDLVQKGAQEAPPLLFQTSVPNAICSHASIELGIKGINTTFSHKGASAEAAIVHALNALWHDKADVILVGGGDEISEPLYTVYAKLGLLSPQRSPYPEGMRPFDRTRNGFVLGEGAGILVLEALKHARRRGATPYAEVIGYGIAGGTPGVWDYDTDAADIARAITLALSQGDRIDYICAAANSTRQLDRAETAAIKKALGNQVYGVSISAIKSMIGEFEASGGVRGCATVLAIHHGVIPPTINLKEPDPDCDLDYTTSGARERRITYALLNGLASGGTHISILFKRYP